MAKIELPFVQTFKDRHGRQRNYYRRKGHARIALPGEVGSAEFMAAYAEARARDPERSDEARRSVAMSRVPPRSINALVVAYYGSQDFLDLQPRTQSSYRFILDRFRAKYGERGASTVETPHLEAIFLSMAGTPGAVRNLRKRLNTVFGFAVRLGWRRDNPVRETKPPRNKSPGFIPWSEAEIERFRGRWPSGSRERLALELLLCLGQRRSDTRLMGRQHLVDGNKIKVVQQKGGKPLTIRIHPDLQREIDQHPHCMTFVVTEQGAPFSEAGFTKWFVDRAVQAGVIDRTPHGLRKAAGRRLAEAGCTAHEIMAILGHSSLSEAERYTRDARQEVLADSAMDRLEAETRTAGVKPV
ncbi:tyrosine-type recombinase/integrase [Brevundimonas sp.]|uniref:tyrosine-type recombinase/integrase n=1 Tax=Brevundimonas sp. TaxID=1871086 RepID=UPI003918F92F